MGACETLIKLPNVNKRIQGEVVVRIDKQTLIGKEDTKHNSTPRNKIMSMTLSSLYSGSETDTGNVDGSNEDSFIIWTNDIKCLIDSNEFQQALRSTGGLISSAANIVLKATLTPITMSMHITANVAGTAIHMSSNALMHLIPSNESSIHIINQVTSQSSGSESAAILNPHTVLSHAVMGFVPVVTKTVMQIKDQIGSTILNFIAWQNPGESSSKRTKETTMYHSHASAYGDLSPGDSDKMETAATKEGSEENDNRKVTTTVSPQKSIVQSLHFSLRICDLRVESQTDVHMKKILIQLELQHDAHNQHLSEAMNKMVEQALLLTKDERINLNSNHNHTFHFQFREEIQSGTQPILWKAEGTTSRLIKKLNSNRLNSGKLIHMLEKELFIWTGRFQSRETYTYSHAIPLLKARGIIPNMTPRQLLDFFLDSSKVQLYNKFSNGRKDVCIFESNKDGKVTKIVENQTKVPFSSKIIKVLTLLHARPLDTDGENDEFIMVSRSAEMSLKIEEPLHHCKKARSNMKERISILGERNEVIWGVTIMRKVPGCQNKVDLTIMTQTNSCAVPTFFAKKVGLMCANDFFKNLRDLQL